jgi:hypothetical protein
VKEAGEEKMSDNQTQVDLRGLLIMVRTIYSSHSVFYVVCKKCD